MRIRDLVPWRSEDRRGVPVRRGDASLGAFQREMNHLFDEFFQHYERMPFGGDFSSFSELCPSIDMSETEDAIHVSAELPGLDQNDVEVTLSNGILTIQGDKKLDKEDKQQDYFHVERSYGAFRRSLSVPAEVDPEKVDATFKNGVLSISLPKTRPGVSNKKITVRALN